MNARAILSDILNKLMERGADKVALTYSADTSEEFNILHKELNLLRTVAANSISLGVIKDQKQASTRLNQFDSVSIDKAIDSVLETVENSNPDPAFDISPRNEGSWTDGAQEPDAEKVILRLQEFIATMNQRYPEVHFEGALTHEKSHKAYLNSNGAWFEHQRGAYGFFTVFTAKKGRKMSSMNYTGFSLGDLDRELVDINFTEDFIRQTTQQIETRPIPANFTGEVIVSPFLAWELLWTFISGHIGDSGLLTNSSKFPDHLGQRILDEKLSLFNAPEDPSLCIKSRFTADGFRSLAAPVIEHGVLKNYPVSLYTANKCGKQRTVGSELSLVVPSGDTPLHEMISSVREGILCMRASFGQPNANGDFSGVAKNSYYIKNGAIAHPISETMLNGNIIDMLNNIAGFSAEAINSGDWIVPYVQFRDVFCTHK